jgi:hypothetical protein
MKMGFGYENFNLWLTMLLDKKLFSYRLQKFSWESRGRHDMTNFLTLLQVPLMVEICGNMVRSRDRFDLYLPLPPDLQFASRIRTSNVEHLVISNARILSTDLAIFLQLPRHLKAFIYKGQHQGEEKKPILDHFRQALNHIAKSLEYFNVEWETGSLGRDDLAIWSFHNFATLKVLCINYDLIYNFEIATASITAKSLPPTLEVLAMHYRHYMAYQATPGDHITFWEILLSSKSSTCLTRLRLIAHLRNPEFLSSIADLARSHDVEVALTKARLELEGIF